MTDLETKIKLNRFFNIFNPRVYNKVLVAALLLTIFEIVYVKNHKSFVASFLGVCFVIVAFIFSECLHCEKHLVIGKKCLKFDNLLHIRPGLVRGYGLFWLKVSYCVTDICNISFKQNAFEKFFNTGRLTFSGKATFEAKRDMDKIKLPETFYICGIKNFSEFKETFPFKN